MATTTNYGWTTPDDTALVKDGAAAIRTLGSSVDTTTKNLNPETTLGDIAYRSSTANVKTRLGIGSTGNVLTVAGGVPTWAAPSGGKILQIVHSSTTTETTSSSSTYADTTLTATITPTSASSTILVMASHNGVYKDSSFADNAIQFQLLRASTQIAFTALTAYTGTAVLNAPGSHVIIKQDSPATTSATTYKTQFRNFNNTVTIFVQGGNSFSSMTLLEIGA